MYPDSRERAAMFLKALPIMRGIVAEMVIPVERERPKMFFAPVWNLVRREAGSRVRTSSGKIAPSS